MIKGKDLSYTDKILIVAVIYYSNKLSLLKASQNPDAMTHKFAKELMNFIKKNNGLFGQLGDYAMTPDGAELKRLADVWIKPGKRFSQKELAYWEGRIAGTFQYGAGIVRI